MAGKGEEEELVPAAKDMDTDSGGQGQGQQQQQQGGEENPSFFCTLLESVQGCYDESTEIEQIERALRETHQNLIFFPVDLRDVPLRYGEYNGLRDELVAGSETMTAFYRNFEDYINETLLPSVYGERIQTEQQRIHAFAQWAFPLHCYVQTKMVEAEQKQSLDLFTDAFTGLDPVSALRNAWVMMVDSSDWMRTALETLTAVLKEAMRLEEGKVLVTLTDPLILRIRKCMASDPALLQCVFWFRAGLCPPEEFANELGPRPTVEGAAWLCQTFVGTLPSMCRSSDADDGDDGDVDDNGGCVGAERLDVRGFSDTLTQVKTMPLLYLFSRQRACLDHFCEALLSADEMEALDRQSDAKNGPPSDERGNPRLIMRMWGCAQKILLSPHGFEVAGLNVYIAGLELRASSSGAGDQVPVPGV